jgi:UDP-N-acetylmuramyl pentapeptide synthase
MSNLPDRNQNHNTAPFSRANLRELFGEQTNTVLPRDFRALGVSTDTRTLQAGNIFVALVGERFDGHSLISEAVQKGASLVVVNENTTVSLASVGAPCLRVENTLHALGELAHFHRSRFEIPVVAVAGAAGKTTTKEMITCVLGQEYTVLKTEGNFNNQIGVPLTLLRLEESHTVAVIEIGTNEPGEIEILSNIVAPTHGIITNIGKEHLEKLIDLDGVERRTRRNRAVPPFGTDGRHGNYQSRRRATAQTICVHGFAMHLHACFPCRAQGGHRSSSQLRASR